MKKAVFFVAVAAVGSGAVMLSASAGKGFAASNDAAAVGLTATSANPEGLNSNSGTGTRLLFTMDPNFAGKNPAGSGAGELFFKMIVLVLVVVGLWVGASYASKRFGTRITKLSGREIRIIETAHIGPRKVLHLVGVGERKLLIGSTNENIRVLADVTDAVTAGDLAAVENEQVPGGHLT